MREVELLVVLRLATWPSSTWTYKALSDSLGLAYARTHGAVAGAARCRLFDLPGKRIQHAALLEFLEHGVKYAFPAEAGEAAIGIRTGPDAMPMREQLARTHAPIRVWPAPFLGSTEGACITPLHRVVPEATRQDLAFYEIMALVDVLRLNESARQVNLAMDLLRARLQ